ncbi:hypothetical protein CJF31_00009573 [Rutstroemia sp. NJR-2017a BVV2]|nr:hypothetical protein CJF31_00009573 [Rutstroemia sp. NJR-2017a BVV2]
MTQIKRIRYSIHPLIQFQYLELISSFKFLPWITTPYTIEISKLSKELEAENHKNLAILLAPNQYSRISQNSRRDQALYEASREIVPGHFEVLGNEKADLLAKSGTKIDPLKIKYSYLKSYLYLLGYTSNNKYICKAKETSKYLFLSCSLFSLVRTKLKDKLITNHLSFLLLLDTSSGIEVSINYLNKINIYTRKYYLVCELEDN